MQRSHCKSTASSQTSVLCPGSQPMLCDSPGCGYRNIFQAQFRLITSLGKLSLGTAHLFSWSTRPELIRPLESLQGQLRCISIMLLTPGRLRRAAHRDNLIVPPWISLSSNTAHSLLAGWADSCRTPQAPCAILPSCLNYCPGHAAAQMQR